MRSSDDDRGPGGCSIGTSPMEFIAQDIREKVNIQLQIYLIHFIT